MIKIDFTFSDACRQAIRLRLNLLPLWRFVDSGEKRPNALAHFVAFCRHWVSGGLRLLSLQYFRNFRVSQELLNLLLRHLCHLLYNHLQINLTFIWHFWLPLFLR